GGTFRENRRKGHEAFTKVLRSVSDHGYRARDLCRSRPERSPGPTWKLRKVSVPETIWKLHFGHLQCIRPDQLPVGMPLHLPVVTLDRQDPSARLLGRRGMRLKSCCVSVNRPKAGAARSLMAMV